LAQTQVTGGHPGANPSYKDDGDVREVLGCMRWYVEDCWKKILSSAKKVRESHILPGVAFCHCHFYRSSSPLTCGRVAVSA
jgi:hypothetical protein